MTLIEIFAITVLIITAGVGIFTLNKVKRFVRYEISNQYDCQPRDASKGEWRCNCIRDRHYDTSVNASYVSRCLKCGMVRP